MTPEPSDPVVQRRVAVGPVVAAVVALVMFAVIVTVVITLAAASSVPASTATSAVDDSPSAEVQETSVPEPESTIVPPRAASTGTECVDYTAEVESLDIESAQVHQSDRAEIFVEITLTEPVARDSAELGIYVERSDGDRAYQFSVELDEGEIDDVTSYQLGSDESDSLDSDDAELDGSTVRFVVPRSLGKKVGEEWLWFAFSAARGSTIDACPGTPNAAEFLRFER